MTKRYRDSHKAQRNEYSRQYYQTHKKAVREYQRQYRLEHLTEAHEASKRYCLSHREQRNAQHRAYVATHREEIRASGRKSYKKHREERIEKIRIYEQSHKSELKMMKRAIKLDVLTHYGGGICACVTCGFDDLRALTIDHINGHGNAHRRSLGSCGGYAFYLWLRRNQYPDGYQTLCSNCQKIKQETDGEYAFKQKRRTASASADVIEVPSDYALTVSVG